MSKTTKRKYVMDEVLVQQLTLPTEKQSVVKIIASKGNNLHEVESDNGEHCLMSMPPKYRKSVWVKRGDFVLVEPIEEGDKVKAEMVAVLTPDHIQFYADGGAWPTRFASAIKTNVSQDTYSDDSDSDAGLGRNMNRPPVNMDRGSSSSGDDDSEENDSGQDSGSEK